MSSSHIDFRRTIHELLAQDLSIPQFMEALITAHQQAHLQYDWEPLKQVPIDQPADLLRFWLAAAVKRQRPPTYVKALWFGLFNPIRSGETLADMYVAGCRTFEMNQMPCSWNLRPAYWPDLRCANSRALRDIYRCAYDGDKSPGNEAENYVCLGYAAKVVATLLSQIDTSLILSTSQKKPMQIAVGWDSGTPLYIGHLAHRGFVTRPLAEAFAGIDEEGRRWRAMVVASTNSEATD